MKLDGKFLKTIGWVAAGAAVCQTANLAYSGLKPETKEQLKAPIVEPLKKADLESDIVKSKSIFRVLAKKAIPSVVNISTVSTVRSGPNSPDEFFGQLYGGGGYGSPRMFPPPSRRSPKVGSLGTGFIIDPKGIILTNNHVVQGADEIKIQFTEDPDEKPTDGKVMGRDTELDVALIRVKPPHELTALPLGDSDAIEVGDYVMAVGNPFGNGHSASHGIISGKGRPSPGLPLASYLQSDAPINPGNSGGPLLDLEGKVVGINNAIEARAQGIGFAIPINYVKKILPQLETKGEVQRGYIGALIGALTPEIAKKLDFDPEKKATIVTEVSPGSPAAKGGLLPYDVITEVDGVKARTPNEVVAAITSAPVGKKIDITISREGKNKIIAVIPQPRPVE